MSTNHSLTIVIVGGVAGGASAATRARRVNEHARIILFEKDEHVSFANCGLPYYIGGEIEEREKLLVATPELLRDRFNIEVRARCEVTGIDREHKAVEVIDHTSGQTFEQAYDKLILAPGASPIVPPIEGVRSKNVMALRNLEDTDRIHARASELLGEKSGDRRPRAVVVGAGFIGLEMVEQLHRLGMDVALVELQDQVLPLLDPEMARPLERALAARGVALHLGDGIKAIEASNEVARAVELNSGTRLEADLVIMGIGVRPNVQLAESAGLELGAGKGIKTNRFMQTSDPSIYAAGDAVEYPYGPTGRPQRIALAGPANRAGRIAGQHAATGTSAEMADVWGVAIVRVFDVAAAATGLSEALARRLEIPARSVIVRGNHHAGYFPGAEMMTIKLVYQPETGRVLGAQVVGGEGVDKRIDVITTAMHFGATVRDLAGLDLAYAPPFGAAKDPVHQAGFAASNELDGLVRFLDADAELGDRVLLDVRSREEVAAAPQPGAVHIPIDELRGRVNELEAGQPIATLCAAGQRAYIAARMLMGRGFEDVVVLRGGTAIRSADEEAAETEAAAIESAS